ncbi:MAG: endonuclease/exonuclease/phosphatase family protein [Acidobacteriota bacterium]
MRLLSWNVLADSYIRASYYPRSEPALLRRGARTAAIVEALANDPADVGCLQEVEPALVAAIRVRLPGWELRFAGKRGKPDGVAMLARASALDDVTTLELAGGFVALLATIDGLRVATTHLRWDPPGTPPDARWAIRQARALAAAAPDVICGDLNVEPGDDALALLLDAGYVDPGGTPTANPNGRAKRIDYILVRGRAATALPAPPVADDTPLPSRDMPSDHVPIAATIA